MRCKNVKFKITFPMPINKPDGNNVMFEENAIRKAVENFKPGTPFIQVNDKKENIPVGYVNSLEYDEQAIAIIAEGVIYYGGFNEDVTLLVDNMVKEMSFVAMGFSAN